MYEEALQKWWGFWLFKFSRKTHTRTHNQRPGLASQEAKPMGPLPRKLVMLQNWMRLRMASSVFLVTFRRASVFWWLKWESSSRAPSSNTSISFFFLEIVIKGRRPAPALREKVKASEFSSSLFAVTKWEKLKEMGAEGHILQLKKKIKINWCNGKEPACQHRKHKTHNRLIPGSGRSPGGGNCNPLQCSCLENPMDRGASWATVHDVAKSQMGPSLHIRTYTKVQ